MEKSIEQHLHANERSCCGCCFVMRACKDSTSICMKHLSKPHTIVGHKGVGARGRDGFFARMGR
jgi:hypothetical protein